MQAGINLSTVLDWFLFELREPGLAPECATTPQRRMPELDIPAP